MNFPMLLPTVCLMALPGHAPRQLDRSIALVGGVVAVMGRLATVSRVSDPMGFYEHPVQYVPIVARPVPGGR
jgi:peptidylprolyl isomerase